MQNGGLFGGLVGVEAPTGVAVSTLVGASFWMHLPLAQALDFATVFMHM
jgi:hypothetical protein